MLPKSNYGHQHQDSDCREHRFDWLDRVHQDANIDSGKDVILEDRPESLFHDLAPVYHPLLLRHACSPSMTTHYAPDYKPEQKPEPPIRVLRVTPVRDDFREMWRVLKKLFKFVAVVGIALYIVIAVFSAIDDAGWITRHSDTDMLIGNTVWMAGEFRTCHAQATPSGKIYDLDCRYPGEDYGDGREHTLPVRFWGRVERTDVVSRGSWTWKCQRKEDSVICWAVD